MNETSVILKQIGGVILVQTYQESKLYCIEDLAYCNELTTGQLFNAVRVLNGKTIADYGTLWPHFTIQSGERQGERSEQFRTINEVLARRDNDLAKLKLVFAHLGEEFPEPVPTHQYTQEQLDVFNNMITRYASKAAV